MLLAACIPGCSLVSPASSELSGTSLFLLRVEEVAGGCSAAVLGPPASASLSSPAGGLLKKSAAVSCCVSEATEAPAPTASVSPSGLALGPVSDQSPRSRRRFMGGGLFSPAAPPPDGPPRIPRAPEPPREGLLSRPTNSFFERDASFA